MEVDGQWIISISERLAALPEIKRHLERQNDSIARAVVTVQALDQRVVNLDTRVTILETLSKNLAKLATSKEERTRARWEYVLGIAVRVGEGLLLLYLAVVLALK